jgi:hypothetical protein
MSPPSANGENGAGGRGSNGRFLPGNPGGPGNPHARQAQAIRSALFAAVTPADLAEAAKAILEKAKAGDVVAFRELCDRLLGTPGDAWTRERLGVLEDAVASGPWPPPA